jgi:hypothetical protein
VSRDEASSTSSSVRSCNKRSACASHLFLFRYLYFFFSPRSQTLFGHRARGKRREMDKARRVSARESADQCQCPGNSVASRRNGVSKTSCVPKRSLGMRQVAPVNPDAGVSPLTLILTFSLREKELALCRLGHRRRGTLTPSP